MGNDGQDFIFLGTDMGSEVFAGTGNDFIYGNKNAERILGNEGNDWIETGTFDGAPGDNFDEIFAHDGIDGHDVFLGDGGFDEFIGEGGDDIMVGSAGRGKMVGMSGFDWATYKDNLVGVNADLSIPIIFDEAPTLPQNAALDEFESMEGLSGTKFNDVLAGTEDVAADRAPLSAGGTTGYLGSVLDAEGIALIAGLQAVLGAGVTSFDGGDIILGGDGSDTHHRQCRRRHHRRRQVAGRADRRLRSRRYGACRRTDRPAQLHDDARRQHVQRRDQSGPAGASCGRSATATTSVDSDGIADLDRAVFSGARAEYDIDFNADGTITVAHTGGLATDGTDTHPQCRESCDFTDQDISLQAPTLDLHGQRTATTTATVAQAYRDTFGAAAYNNNNGASSWAGNWTETDDNGGATGADVNVSAVANRLRFVAGTDGNESCPRRQSYRRHESHSVVRLIEADDLDAGETVSVEARNSTAGAWTQRDDDLAAIRLAASRAVARRHGRSEYADPLRAGCTYDAGENFFVDNVNIATRPTRPRRSGHARQQLRDHLH